VRTAGGKSHSFSKILIGFHAADEPGDSIWAAKSRRFFRVATITGGRHRQVFPATSMLIPAFSVLKNVARSLPTCPFVRPKRWKSGAADSADDFGLA